MKVTDAQVAEAIELLQNGGVVVFPTETAYGLACDATNVQAVERLIKIKKRPTDMPMALIVADMPMARWCGDVDPALETFTKKHWPGPLTIVIPNANAALSPHCLRGGTVGLRISSHPVACALTQGLDRPIIATSANVHGKPTTYTVTEAKSQFDLMDDAPDIYLDEGELEQVPPSMIIELINGEVVIHRKGSFRL